MPPSGAHAVLIVEDHPDTAQLLVDLAESLGHAPRVAATLDEVRVHARAGLYCYALVDMEIPARPGAVPLMSNGEAAIQALRALDKRRNDDGYHLFPILVVTGYSTEPEFVVRMYELQASGFVAKPLAPRVAYLTDQIRTHLKRAGREDHAACFAAQPEAPAVANDGVHVVFDAARMGRRAGALLNGKRFTLQDAHLLFLLKLVAAHQAAPGQWAARHGLGAAATSPETPARTVAALREVVPAGFDLVESDRRGQYRWNPKATVVVDWGAYSNDGHAGVKKLAKEQARKRD